MLIAGNVLFQRCYPLYLPLYKAYKALSDRREREFLRKIVKPGMRIVDVGANIGIYTNYFAGLVGPNGAVYAFEPSPENFSRLQHNVLPKAGITTVQAAVGDSNGTVDLFLSDQANVDHRTYDSGDGRRKVTVPLVCLDDYFSPGTRIDFIKIDVQGHEYSVLKGASRLLKENPRIVCLLEIWPYGLTRAGVKSSDLMRFISGLGFVYEVVGDGGPGVIERLDSDDESDYCNIAIWRAI